MSGPGAARPTPTTGRAASAPPTKLQEPSWYSETTSDGVTLSLGRFSHEGERGTPVLLTHGTFSNAQACSGLAGYLAERGLDCWVLELRGHGRSERGREPVDFERFSNFDVPAGLEAVRRWTGKPRVLLVGHSGGGLVFLMHLAREAKARKLVKGIVMLASQATEAGATRQGRLKIVGYALVNNILGYTPGPLMGLGPEDEFCRVLNQWSRWNWTRRWVGRDGFDYLAALKEIEVPALCLAGAGDRFIAPVAGCRRLYEALGGADKRFVTCAKTEGFGEDYGHARIIASRRARQEVWPLILEWLTERS